MNKEWRTYFERARKMNKSIFILLISLLLIRFSFASRSVSTRDREAQLETISEILRYIYKDNLSDLPATEEDIAVLETSTDSKDLLAFALLEMMEAIQKGELDLYAGVEANSSSATEEAPIISDESLSASSAEVNNESKLSLSPDLTVGLETVSMYAMESAEELSGPLDSCIIPSGTYIITSLPLQIEGHVVICAGATLIAPFDPNSTVIEVMPGGRLETGKAAFYDQGDNPNILPPVKIVPEDPNIIYNHNNIGIFIHRGADPKTQIENVIVESCSVGILMDEALLNPIKRVITFGCYDGIHLYAPAGIVDCQFWNNGSIWIGPFGYVGTGIYVSLNWDEDEPEVAIDRTTIYFADAALYVEGGSSDPNNSDPNQVVPTVSVVNSALTGGMYYGLYQSSGEAVVDVQYCAFGGNRYTSNIDLPFTGCVEVNSNPFYNREEDWEKLYVHPWSGLIDTGYGLASDGTGVCHDKPDTGQMDIGCHFSLGITGSFGIPSSPADFNGDGVVDEADLELMQMCMSAVTDPNVVKLDGNYDSRINLPDFGLFAADYGYCGDPNFCTNNDPNCLRSDFNGDRWVDLTDLAILVESWLVPVFDENRLCSLCNLSPGSDPNQPEVIDTDDMDVFMADWGKLYGADPNIVVEPSVSQISVTVENPAPAWRVSVFLDENPVGWWEAETLGSTSFDADLTRYGPGSHRLKIVRNIDYGLEITEQVIYDSNSIGLFFADIPDAFEPNEPYCIRGFNLGDELNLKIDTIRDETVYDVNVPSGAIELTIPAGIFESRSLCTLSLTVPNDLMMDRFYVTGYGGSDEKRYKKLLKEQFNPNDWDGRRARVVFLLPDAKVRKVFWEAICSAIKAVEDQGLTYVVLTEHDVNQDNFDFLFGEMPGRRIVIYFGHANAWVGRDEQHGIDGVQRTCFQCFRKSTIQNPGAFYNVGAFSYTRRSNLQASALPLYNELPTPLPLDNIAYDVTQQIQQCKIDKMFIFGCLSAAYPDMAIAQGCDSLWDHSHGDMMYCGFGIKVLQANGGWMEGIGDNLVRGLSIFFDKLGQDKTMTQGIEAIQLEGIGIRNQCLGLNGSYDADPDEDDHQALRFYGVQALNQKLY